MSAPSSLAHPLPHVPLPSHQLILVLVCRCVHTTAPQQHSAYPKRLQLGTTTFCGDLLCSYRVKLGAARIRGRQGEANKGVAPTGMPHKPFHTRMGATHACDAAYAYRRMCPPFPPQLMQHRMLPHSRGCKTRHKRRSPAGPGLRTPRA